MEYAEIYDYEDIELDYKRSTKRELNSDLKHNFLDGTSSKIHDTDFKCLNTGEWLNGTIIDFFNKYYREEVLKDQIDKETDVKEEYKTYDLDSLSEEIKRSFMCSTHTFSFFKQHGKSCQQQVALEERLFSDEGL